MGAWALEACVLLEAEPLMSWRPVWERAWERQRAEEGSTCLLAGRRNRPGEPNRRRSAVGRSKPRSLHTREVAGSKPAAPIV